MESLSLIAAVLVVTLAVVGIVRGWDVRLVLMAAAGVIGALSGDVRPVLRAFFETFSGEKFVTPICTAMGFAYVLKHTGCDAQLVNLLLGPVRRVRFLMVPGVVLAGFVVNIPVVSQSSTAVCLGTVVVPLMRSAGFSPLTIGTSLLLGASVGGELLNPSAVELLAVKAKTGADLRTLSWGYIPPLVLPVLLVSTAFLWWRCRKDAHSPADGVRTVTPEETPPRASRVNVLQALVPLVPLLLLFLSGPPLEWLQLPPEWVALPAQGVAGSRLIGLAMLIGVGIAALAAPRKAGGCMRAFFDGAGYAFANVISLIVVAQCFGEALKGVGLAAALGRFIAATPDALEPLAAVVPCLFALVCGSGIASSQSLYPFFYDPAVAVGEDPNAIGGLVSVGSAVGRTLSPVSAVALMCGTLAGAKATDLSKRLAIPLVAGLTAAVAVHLLRQWFR